jgi:hypothetical protein
MEEWLFNINQMKQLETISLEHVCQLSQKVAAYVRMVQVLTKYFWMSSEPTTLRNVADVWLATAFASKVFPVPGGPYRITPLGGLIPISS